MGKNAARNRFNVNFIVVALFVWSMVFPGPVRNALAGVGEDAQGAVSAPQAPSEASGSGSVSLSFLGSPVLESFNSLGSTTAQLYSTLPTGWYFDEQGPSKNYTYGADNGASGTGNTVSYGTSSASDRAFGTLRSGNLVPMIGVQLKNNTGTIVNSLAVSFTGEQWRVGTSNAPDRLDFQYSTDAITLSTGTWIDVNGLDFASLKSAAVAASLDGNLAANRASIAATVSGLSIAPGATIWLRWVDAAVVSGSQDGLAIDDFSVVPQSLCSPVLIASDNASNYTTASWVHNSNLGNGFDVWRMILSSGNSSQNGFFVGSSAANGAGSVASPNINTSGLAWGLYANSSQTASAERVLATAVAVGDSLVLKMDNGNITNPGTVGFGIQNSSGQNLMEMYFVGGSTNYVLNDATGAGTSTGVPYVTTGVVVTVTLASATTYNIAINRLADGTTASFSARSLIAPAGGQAFGRVRLFNFSAGGTAGIDDQFFNSLDQYHLSDGCIPTPTPTSTPIPPTATNTPTATPIPPSATNTPTNTNTPTVTPTVTPTDTNTPTVTPTNTPTNTSTPTVTPTDTNTPTVTPTNTNTPTPVPPTPTNTPTPNYADYCVLQYPASFSVASGANTDLVYGRIYESSLTPAGGADPSVVAELGYGPLSSDPTGNLSWAWFGATFNAQYGNDDEYMASFTAPTVAIDTQYAYAYRFSLDAGAHYTYCDTDGAGTNPGLSFDPNLLGLMTVNAPTPTPTNTPVPPTETPTNTPVPPTETPTNTPVPPTETPTNTPVPPTETPTNTPVPPTATNTPTETPIPPTATNTPTETPVPPTATNTPTETPIPPTATPTSTPGPLPPAMVSGVVRLQGRATPGTPGSITLVDASGALGSIAGAFDASTGAFSLAVQALAGGTTYTLTASHALYLSNEKTLTVFPGGAYVQPATTLRGGDADNSGVVGIPDLACIGGAFGGLAAPCGTGSSDLNGDGVVNIFDLVNAGANYGLISPQPWP